MSNPELLANKDITATEVRVIHEDGRNEVVSRAKALYLACEAGTDLVQMNDAEQPVCKLIDFSDYKYQLKQADKAKKKKQRETAVQTKEIQLSIDIQDHDIAIKQKATRKFLDKGKQVAIKLRLTGRAKGNSAMQELAKDKIEIFIQNIGKFAFVKPVNKNGDTIQVIVK